MAADWSARYARVQKCLDSHEGVPNGTVYPRWMGTSGCFWYDRKEAGDTHYVIVDAAAGTRRTAFAYDQVIDAIDRACGTALDRRKSWIRNLLIDDADEAATFDVYDRSWRWDIAAGRLEEAQKVSDSSWASSPDGRLAILSRDFNLFVRPADGAERQLTFDGEEFNAYGLPPASRRQFGVQAGAAPEGLWSPDSRWYLTLQADDRHVPELAIMAYAPAPGGRPVVSANRTALPGDTKPTEFRIVAIEVATGRIVEARYPRLAAVRMNDTIFSGGISWWSKDGATAYFVDIERGEKRAHVVAFDIATGATRVVFSEESDTYLELSVSVYTPALIFPLPATDELIWYSERSGNGHLYLYDLATGKLKRQVTSGDWRVREVLDVDEARRELFLRAGGIGPEPEPYLCKPCTVAIDSGEVAVVSNEPGDHLVWRPGEFSLLLLRMQGADPTKVSGLSPDGAYFVETIGGVDRMPRSVLRHRDGREIMLLEAAEEAHLPEGWQWPEPVVVKADDGVTDVYGLLFKPADFDPESSYPLIDYVYGGPQTSFVPKSIFADPVGTGTCLELAGFAEMGAFALALDGRGTAFRERAFREASYGAIHTASNIEDHIAAIRQIAARIPSIDLDRVGMTGFSGGGYMTVMAALRHGDIFKVAVAGGGNYDQSLFWHGWGERYHGRFSEDHYAIQAARTYADGLTGKLMLVHGLMDTGCHPSALFQLVQALIEANKDVDLVILPRAMHEFPGYAIRRRLDYFVEHLFGETPPEPVRMRAAADDLLALLASNAGPMPKPAGQER